MKKICAIITNQAHYSRGKLILEKIKKHPKLDLILVIGGSALLDKYGDLSKVIEDDGFEIHSRINMLIEGSSPSSMAKTTGLGLLEFSTALENIKPDMVLIRGDRYEILAPTIAASYLNIPIAHIEGGDVSGTIDESVRHAVTKFSHLHLTTNELSKDRVIKMGENPINVFNVGSPDIEILSKQNLSFDQDELWGGNIVGVGGKPDLSKGFIFVMQHPVTTEYEQSRSNIRETIKAIDKLKIPTVWIWPNVDAGADSLSKELRIYRETSDSEHLHLFRYLGIDIFCKLLNNALCVVGNSSAGIKESSYLGTPSVNVGTRQKGRLSGANVIHVSHNAAEIQEAILDQIDNGKYPADELYFKPETSKNIAEILATTEVDLQKKLYYE